ncbi:hypothetical protein, partial [Paraburkholderia sp. UCT31]|uniref:hypothetical protein n=1 Tax=Paraburkholderia sp. UCT31 TaxID=2615209 RepID=UPI001CA40E58
PLRLPGLAFGSVTVMSIKSKMMGTILMSVLAVVYDGRREVLTDLIAHPPHRLAQHRVVDRLPACRKSG